MADTSSNYRTGRRAHRSETVILAAPEQPDSLASVVSNSTQARDVSQWLCLYYYIRLAIVSKDASSLLWYNDDEMFHDFTLYFRVRTSRNSAVGNVSALRDQVASGITEQLLAILEKAVRHDGMPTYSAPQITPEMLEAYKATFSKLNQSHRSSPHKTQSDLSAFLQKVIDQGAATKPRVEGSQIVKAPVTASTLRTSIAEPFDVIKDSSASDLGVTSAIPMTTTHASISLPQQAPSTRATSRLSLVLKFNLHPERLREVEQHSANNTDASKTSHHLVQIAPTKNKRGTRAVPLEAKRARTTTTQGQHPSRREGLFYLVDERGNILGESARDALVIGRPDPEKLRLQFRKLGANITENPLLCTITTFDWQNKEHINHANRWRSQNFKRHNFPAKHEVSPWAEAEIGFIELYHEKMAAMYKTDKTIKRPNPPPYG